MKTYDTEIENSPDNKSMWTLNYKGNDGSEDQKIPQIGSLRETLVSAKGIRKYISSNDIQNISLFSNTVELENALTRTYEITTPQANKQTKTTDFLHKC